MEKSIGNPMVDERRISVAAVLRFIRQCEEKEVDLHSFLIYRDNRLAARASIPPYDCTDKRQLYSLSKSFVSTAIGFAQQEGLLHAGDKVIDFLADKFPEKVSVNQKNLRICDLLTMRTGHVQDITSDTWQSEDIVKRFFELDLEREPGTWFNYNTAATHVLSAIITEVTGETLMDYLTPRLFLPLEIHDAYWNTTPQGITEGGVGLHISCDDVAKFGLLYLNEGNWNGTQLLSPEWIKQASCAHADNRVQGGTLDWKAGYGYQIWMNGRGGYRADGAAGQVCLIIPEENIVFAALSECENMQNLLDAMFELVEHMDYESGQKNEKDFVDALKAAKPFEKKLKTAIVEKTYSFDKNIFGITKLRFIQKSESMDLIFSDGTREQTIYCKQDGWQENVFCIRRLKPVLSWMKNGNPQPCRAAVNCGLREDKLAVQFRFLDCPHKLDMICDFKGQAVKIEFVCRQDLMTEEERWLCGNVRE